VQRGRLSPAGQTLTNMRALHSIAVALAFAVTAAGAADATGRVIKVLPQYVDKSGRVALSPSLFERDAYQAHLRDRPSECAGLRFSIQWKARNVSGPGLKLRTELITTRHPKSTPLIIETPVKARSGWSRWTNQSLMGDAFREAGELIAWRVSLWAGDKLLAERKSFLW